MAQGGSVTIKAILDTEGVKKGVRDAEKALKGIDSGSLKDVDDAAEKAGRSLSDAADDAEKAEGGVKKASEAARDASGRFTSLKDSADKAGKGLDDAKGKSEGLGESFDGLKGKIDVASVAVAGAAAGMGAAIFSTASEYESATSRIQAALGTSREEAERFRDIGAEIYEAGWGESLTQVTDALTTVKSTIRDIDDEGLQTVTKNALALEEVFGADLNETIRGTNALMEGFGITAEEASDLMAAGMQRGLNYTDELGDNLSEYAGRWGDAGMSASQYFSLLEAGASNGAYQLDKVGDFLNEFLTSLSDGRMEESIGKFSQGTQDVFSAFKEGGATAEDVLNAVIGELSQMPDEYAKAQIASELWSSLGEDNAMSMIESLANVEDSYGNVAGAAEDVADTMEQSFGQKMQSAMRELAGSVEPLGDAILNIAGFVADLIGQFAEWFGGMEEGEQIAVVAFAAIIAAIKPVSGVVKGAADMVGTFTGFLRDLKTAADTNATGIDKTTKATGKLKTALVRTGFGAIAVAIGAVVGAIMDFVNAAAEAEERSNRIEEAGKGVTDTFDDMGPAIESARGSLGEYGKTADEIRQETDDLLTAHEDFKQSLSDTMAEAGGEIGTLEHYRDVINDLGGKSERSAGEQRLLEDAVSKVNEMCGTNIDVTGQVSGALYDQVDAINAVIGARKEQLEYEAMLATTNAIAEEKARAEVDLQVAQAQLDALYQQAGIDPDGTFLMSDITPEMKAAAEQVQAAQAIVDGLAESYDVAIARVEALGNALGSTAAEFVQFAQSNEEVSAALSDMGVDMDAAAGTLESLGLSVSDFSSLSNDQLIQLFAAASGGIEDFLAKAEEMGVELPLEFTEAVQGAAAGVQAASPALQTAMQSATAGAITYWDDAKQKIVTLSGEAMVQAAQTTYANTPGFTQAVSLAMQGASVAFDPLTNSFQITASEAMLSASTAVYEGTPGLDMASDAAQQAATWAFDPLTESWRRISTEAMDAATSTVTEKTPELTTAADNAEAQASNAYDPLDDDFRSTTDSAMSQSEQAIRNGTPGVESAASSLEATAAAAVDPLATDMPNTASSASTGFGSRLYDGFDLAKTNAALLAEASAGMNAYSGSAWTWGSHLGGSFASGISSAYSAVVNAANSLVSAVAARMHFTKPDIGPLSEGTEVWGEHLAEQYAGGMGKGEVAVRMQAESLAAVTSAALAPDIGIGWYDKSLSAVSAAKLGIGQDGSALAPPARSYRSGGSGKGDVTYNAKFNITATVREEADIERIAREIERRMRQYERSKGR